ncbi:MAG: hypothetical protein JWR83_2336 [Aeromicrobium sp.]|nr:hypothetical protein [Aeromicrobium sp.]
MVDPPPSWYLDPTKRHQLRFWDGLQWTDHVASAGLGGVDPVGQPGSIPNATGVTSRVGRFVGRHLGWVGLLLCVLAISAGAVTGVGLDRATGHHGVRLDGSTQHVRLPAHQKYGVYIDDANNSGYTEDCSAVDSDERPVRLADPGWGVSSSDTGDLDYVFNTGSGALTFDCSVPGERVTLRPVPNRRPSLVGIVIYGVFGFLGAALIITWLVLRIQRRRQSEVRAVALSAYGRPIGRLTHR